MAHTRLCGEMYDRSETAAGEQCRAGVLVGEVDVLECEARPTGQLRDARLLEVDVVVRLVVVDADDRSTRIEQRARRVHADEARHPGHQHAPAVEFDRGHGRRSVWSRARSLACLRKLANAPIAMWAKPAAPSRKPSLKT